LAALPFCLFNTAQRKQLCEQTFHASYQFVICELVQLHNFTAQGAKRKKAIRVYFDSDQKTWGTKARFPCVSFSLCPSQCTVVILSRHFDFSLRAGTILKFKFPERKLEQRHSSVKGSRMSQVTFKDLAITLFLAIRTDTKNLQFNFPPDSDTVCCSLQIICLRTYCVCKVIKPHVSCSLEHPILNLSK
jgi:hypothetical protein